MSDLEERDVTKTHGEGAADVRAGEGVDHHVEARSGPSTQEAGARDQLSRLTPKRSV